MAISLAPLHTHCWPSEVTGPPACVQQCCPPCLVCPPPFHGLAALEAFLEVAHCGSDTFLPRPGTQMTQVPLRCIFLISHLCRGPRGQPRPQARASVPHAPGLRVPQWGHMAGPQVPLTLQSQSSSTPYSWPTALSLAMEAWGWGDSGHTARGDCAQGTVYPHSVACGHSLPSLCRVRWASWVSLASPSGLTCPQARRPTRACLLGPASRFPRTDCFLESGSRKEAERTASVLEAQALGPHL